MVVADLTALTFPADDAVFALRVREALHELADSGGEDIEKGLTKRLRQVHPNVATRRRASLAGFGGRTIYVFRDGTALSSLRDESWTGEVSTARVVTDDEGRYLEANEAAAELFGVTRDEIVGREAGSFTRPDARIDQPDALWRALSTSGTLHSLAVLRCADGSEESVEFITIRDGDGPRRHATFLRPIE
jgi:PAS domain S-box-containing protein